MFFLSISYVHTKPRQAIRCKCRDNNTANIPVRFTGSQLTTDNWALLPTDLLSPSPCPLHSTHISWSQEASRLQWLPLTMSEAVLIAICPSRCLVTASPVCSGQCSLWCETGGGGEVAGQRSTEKEMMWDNRYRETEREFVCKFSVLYLLKKCEGEMWTHKAVCHTSSTCLGRDIFLHLGRRSSWSFVFDCGFIWWNWWDIGLSIMLSILLWWLKLSASYWRDVTKIQKRTRILP